MEDNKLMEAIVNDPELGEASWNELMAKAQNHPFYAKILKEGLYRDVAGALGAVQATVWPIAWENAIGRELIKVMRTTNALERFPKEIKAVAYESGEAPPMGTGGRVEFTNVEANIEISAKKEWTQGYIEDAAWNVLQYQLGAIGRALAKKESQKIISIYNAIAAGNLATGAEITITDNAPTWAQVVDLVSAVAEADYVPEVVAMNAPEFGYLFNHDQFISSLYLPHGQADIRKGVVYHSGLGVKFVRSTLISKSLCIDTNASGVFLLRREVNTKPYEDPANVKFGVQGNERYGCGMLRNDAVARGTN